VNSSVNIAAAMIQWNSRAASECLGTRSGIAAAFTSALRSANRFGGLTMIK